MNETPASLAAPGLISRWHHTPLYLRILGALILGLICGELLGPATASWAIPSKLVLRLLGALAPALILVAIIHALMTAQVGGRTTLKMVGLLVLNTVVAILIGLLVANVIQPGRWAKITPENKEILKVGDLKDATGLIVALRDSDRPLSKFVWSKFTPAGQTKLAAVGNSSTISDETKTTLVDELNHVISGDSLYREDLFAGVDLRDETRDLLEKSPKDDELVRLNRFLVSDAYPLKIQRRAASDEKPDILTQFLDNVPKSVLGPLTDEGKVLGVIFLAVALGLALRKDRTTEVRTVQDLVELTMRAFITVLHWIIDVIPFAIFGIVGNIVGTKGFAAFHALGFFVLSVILALILQATYYLLRIKFGTWIRPFDLLRGTRDALVMAFSTASSTATMPVTYERLRKNVGLREESASMGALVGSNFNNDGTALYEAMSALFISQMVGIQLSLPQQFMVVVTSIIASIGAAGIPEAGLVTMTLVFHAVGLPTEYIAILLTVDWFLDRCRTTINVMGDMNVSCLLDGKVREETAASKLA